MTTILEILRDKSFDLYMDAVLRAHDGGEDLYLDAFNFNIQHLQEPFHIFLSNLTLKQKLSIVNVQELFLELWLKTPKKDQIAICNMFEAFGVVMDLKAISADALMRGFRIPHVSPIDVMDAQQSINEDHLVGNIFRAYLNPQSLKPPKKPPYKSIYKCQNN